MRVGFGIGACQAGIAGHDPALVAVLPREVEFGLEMWLAMHEDLRTSRRVRLVYDHLAAGLAGYVASGARARVRRAGSKAATVGRAGKKVSRKQES